jgi:uncharacterized protein YodC (DUF2158 family)
MATQFKPGEVVRLHPIKGPWMLIESCDENSAVCFWFDKTDAGHRETFLNTFLEAKKSETAGVAGFAGTRRREES